VFRSKKPVQITLLAVRFIMKNPPPYTVSPTKQFYHCFGCGAHGTSIGFLMEYQGLSFVEAVHELAKIAGMIVSARNART
jgi:DNA primase